MSLADRWTSRVAGALRLGHAREAGAAGPRPNEPLVLYQYEGCPMCRRVREAMSESADIVEYLYTHYGSAPAPRWLLGTRFVLPSQLVSMVRAPWVLKAEASREPTDEWIPHGAEADPATLRVRQRLDLLEQPYLWKPGSLRLDDPEDGTSLTDPDAILAHLDARCAA